MGLSFLIYAGPEGSKTALHEQIYEQDFSNLRQDKVAIYSFCKELEEKLGKEYSMECTPVCSYFVEYPVSSRDYDELLKVVKELANRYGLVFFDGDVTIWPDKVYKCALDPAQQAEIESLMSDYDDLYFYASDVAKSEQTLIDEAEQGNLVANYLLANTFISRSELYKSAFGYDKPGKLELLDKALVFAERCQHKSYAKDQMQKIHDARALLSK